MIMQKVDLYQPMVHVRVGAPPLAFTVAVNKNSMETANGPIEGAYKPETYVLLSALPEELRERVKTAVQMLMTF